MGLQSPWGHKGSDTTEAAEHTHRWLGAPATDTPGAVGHTPLPAVQMSRLPFEKCGLFSSLLSTCTGVLQSPPFTDPNAWSLPFTDPNAWSPFSAQASHSLQCPSAEPRMGVVLQEP